MTNEILEWLLSNQIELLGAILGIAYIFLSIRQNVLTWPVGLLTSVLYIVVFFQSKLYADMGLQVYYVVASIYGWYYWLRGKNREESGHVPVQTTNNQLRFQLAGTSLVLYWIILFILKNYTDSDVPYLDSLTTALSIVGTWMLAKKYIAHWLIWIFVDIVSAGLYIYKGLWPTVILFIVYSAMAVMGYIEWNKELKDKQWKTQPE